MQPHAGSSAFVIPGKPHGGISPIVVYSRPPIPSSLLPAWHSSGVPNPKVESMLPYVKVNQENNHPVNSFLTRILNGSPSCLWDSTSSHSLHQFNHGFRCPYRHVARFPTCDQGLHGCSLVHGYPPPPGQCGEYFPMFSFFPYCFSKRFEFRHGATRVVPIVRVFLSHSPPAPLPTTNKPRHRWLLAVGLVPILLIPTCACP